MARAFLSDYVTNSLGQPVVGATVTLLRASDYSTPPTSDPGNANGLNYVAQTTSGLNGAFSFDHIPYDDYHLMVQYLGQTSFKYNIPAIAVEIASTKETPGRVLVPRLLSRILAGESVVVHFVGDSITVGYNSTGTVGGGFVQRTGVLIAQQLAPTAAVYRYDPNAYGSLSDAPINGWNGPTTIQSPSAGSQQTIQIVNNGVSGDTIQRVLRRFANLTGWTPPVDAHVIYLGVNDSLTTDPTKFVDPTSFYSGMRGLIDIIRNYYPQSEIVVMTPHYNNQPDAGNGGAIPAGAYTLEQYAMATRRAALEMGVALVDLRQSWQDHYNPSDPNLANNGGFGTWLNTAGGNYTHPTDQGHQAIAEELFKIFGSPGLFAGRAQRFQTLGPQKHFKDLEVVRLPVTNPALNFSGSGWSNYVPSELANLYYSTYLAYSQHGGDTLTFTGRMQDLALLLRRAPDCGQISVTVDSGPPVTYDLYRGFPTSIADVGGVRDYAVYPMDRLWVVRGLLDGEHTVVITVLGTHDANATASYLYLDAIEHTRYGYTARKLECPQENSQVQYGSITGTLSGSYFATVAVTFPKPFRSGNNPCVVGVCNQVDHYVEVDTVTNTGCNVRVVRRDGANETASVTAQWLAVG